MQEETDSIGDPQLAQIIRDGDQMIIVNPDDIFRLQQFRQAAGEHFIDPEIARRITPRNFREIEAVMTYRP